MALALVSRCKGKLRRGRADNDEVAGGDQEVRERRWERSRPGRSSGTSTRSQSQIPIA